MATDVMPMEKKAQLSDRSAFRLINWLNGSSFISDSLQLQDGTMGKDGVKLQRFTNLREAKRSYIAVFQPLPCPTESS